MPQLTITPVFSGAPGGGKSSLANRIAATYGVQVVSAGGILRDKHRGLFPEGAPSFEDWYGSLIGEDVRVLNDHIKNVFEAGGVVGESRFVGHLDPKKCIFVYVSAPLSKRAARLAKDPKRPEYFGRPVDEIAAILLRRREDEARVAEELSRYIYKLGPSYDYTDPRHYHLVLDSGEMTIEEEAMAVETLMGSRRQ